MKKIAKVLFLFGIWFLFFSCRNEESSTPRIEKIEFETEKKSLIEGDTVKITVTAEPIEAKKYNKINYWVSDSSIIEIMTESNNDYVVFRGLKAGQGIIKASVNGMDIFCDVTVISENGTLIPYIMVSDYVIESETGQTHQIIASLIGGYPSDNNDFTWNYTGRNNNVINLVANNNVAVIDTVNTGDSVVTVSHKRALFEVSTLVFVREKGEIPIYISTSNNVINMNTKDDIKEYSVNLFGKNIKNTDNNNYHLFRHDIVDVNDNIIKTSDVIELQYKNNVGTIKPKAKGISKIRVNHQDADYPIEIVVIVNEAVEFRYIDTDDTVIIMNEGEFRMVRANVIGEVSDDYVDKFEYINEDSNVINISRSQNIISIKALKSGKSVITIKNDYVEFDKEILVIVNGKENIIDNEKYITTNQNVITTEVNAEAILKMTLVGGNSADANNFIWTVEDGSIIEMIDQHGSVRYKNRSMLDSIEEKFEAEARIKAKKIGTTTITLENPKAKNSFQVVVKVYRQNVFGVVPIVLGGSGIYRIEKDKNINVYLNIVTGLEKNFTNARWESSDNTIFTVESNTALTGVLKGNGNGIATLTVKGDNLKSEEFTAVVIVGDGDYFDEKPYIYVSNPYMTLIKDRAVSFKINCVNVLDEDIKRINVVNNSGDKLEVFSYRDTVTVKGLSFGEGEIIISGDGLNTLKVIIMVEDYALTPEMPYYLRPEKYIYGVVKNNSIEIQVDLVGGIAVNEKNIVWEIRDENVANIKGNGKKCIITGKNEGQTVLKVSHYQAQNQDVEIVIYVVLSDAELKSKVVVYAPEQNIMIRQGETRFISVITNAVNGQNDFRWGNGDTNVIGLRVNGDKKSAFIEGITLGSAAVTVGYGNNIPFVVYISVVSESFDSAYINVPSIVEMVAGQTVTVSAVAYNIYKYDITWDSQDENIAKAYGNGDKCTVTAFKEGKNIIKVRYPGFVKDIILRVYNSNEEMAKAYIFSGEQSRYIVNKGDIINIRLVFGMKGYLDYDLPNIRWTTDDSSKIDLKGNGKSASVQGLVAGFWKVRAADNYGNDIEIEIAVQEAGRAGKYSFSIDGKDRIKELLAGTDVIIPIKVINSEGNEVYNVSGIRYTAENSDIIRVEAKEGGVRVFAQQGKEGQSYITIAHDLAEDARILIYTSTNESGLFAAYPIMVEKANYMIAKGDTFNLKINTINDNSNMLANIYYGLEKDNGILRIQERNKKEAAVSAEKEGSEVILIYYNSKVAQRVYVSVMEKEYGQNAVYIVTENIIGLVIGQVYETYVDTDVNWNIYWKSENSDICEIDKSGAEYEGEIIELDGKRALLTAKNEGETVVTVKIGDIERKILVFVVDTPEKLKIYNAVNIEQRKYRIFKGTDITINIHSYQGKVEGETRFEDYYRYSVPYGNVLTVNKEENGRISVKGINEGTAAIRITNSFYKSDIVVYVEVYPAREGEIGINVQEHFITAEKTLYILSSEMREVFIQMSVSPKENFYGDYFWEWEGYDKNIISVNSMGRGAIVKGIKEGETRIKVQNQKCANTLEITVIVGERYIIDSGRTPHIYVEKDIYEMVKGSGNIQIPYGIVNIDNIVLKNITFKEAGNGIKVTHDVENSVFNVEALNTGISKFVIMYDDLLKNVYVLVKENLNVGNIYFTTSENFVIATIGELRNINVDLIGYDEIDSGKIKWSLSGNSPRNVIQLVGNGLVGQIYGVAEGSVVINITHEREGEYQAKYPLSINVKIVKDKSKENVVYLTTRRNVIEAVEGASEEMIYLQKVGGDPAKSGIEWSIDNSSIVRLEHSGGYSARLNMLKEGTAKITAKNVETAYDLNIVVVVRKSTGSNIYIYSESNLIWLSPGEINHRISVDLVNGESKDYNRITWSIDGQIPSDPAVPAGSNVINIITSNEQCYIDTVNVGTAYIRVECKGKADLPLIITVYVSQHREVKFGVRHKEVVIGELEVVELDLPSYERLKDKAKVWAEDLNGMSTDVINVYFTNSIVLIQGLKKGNAVVKAAVDGKEGFAEMTVSVSEIYSPDVNRIVISKNMYVVSDTQGQFAINASVSGPNIFEYDQDDIRWEITNNYEEKDIRKEKPLISIFPQTDPPSTLKSKGRTVQITPQNMGNAIIKISHPKVTQNYWKDIYIVVAETDDKFSMVEKGPIEVSIIREPKTVSVNIIGGTNKDYEQVRWVAAMQSKWDGTLLEVVRIMGSGKEVLLMPINNGVTDVYAFYNGKRVEVKVECISEYYFNVPNKNEYMYPTEVHDISYEVGPSSNYVTWNYMPDSTGPVVTLNEIIGSGPGGDGNIVRVLRITALKEGTAIIMGIPSQGRPATINVTVKDDFEFMIEGKKGGPVAAINTNNTAPKYVVYNASGGVKESSTGVVTINYTIYPGHYYIKCVEDTIKDGLTVDISAPEFVNNDVYGRSIFGGTITFTGLKEMYRPVKFQLYKPDLSGGADKPVPSTADKFTERTVNVIYFFPNLEIQPFFVRGDGHYSNTKNYSSSSAATKIQLEQNKGGKVKWLKNEKEIPGAEEIVKHGEYMRLGDGEQHYILLDKKYENADMEIMGISANNGNVVKDENVDITLATVNGEEFKARIVNFIIDGENYKAIALSGGDDYIEYNRVVFDRELYSYMLYIDNRTSSGDNYRVNPVYYNILRQRHVVSPHTNQQGNYNLPVIDSFTKYQNDLPSLKGTYKSYFVKYENDSSWVEYFEVKNIDIPDAKYYTGIDYDRDGNFAGYNYTTHLPGQQRFIIKGNHTGYSNAGQSIQFGRRTYLSVSGTVQGNNNVYMGEYINLPDYYPLYNAAITRQRSVTRNINITSPKIYSRGDEFHNDVMWDANVNPYPLTYLQNEINTGRNDLPVINIFQKNIFAGVNDNKKIYFSDQSIFTTLMVYNHYTKITAPYYVLNFFPFRYEDEIKVQNIGLNSMIQPYIHENSSEFNQYPLTRPMPSTNRNVNGTQIVVLTIIYTKFDINEPNYKKEEVLLIPIQCDSRPSHFQYFGNNIDDTVKVYESWNQSEEIEGKLSYEGLKENHINEYNNYSKYFVY